MNCEGALALVVAKGQRERQRVVHQNGSHPASCRFVTTASSHEDDDQGQNPLDQKVKIWRCGTDNGPDVTAAKRRLRKECMRLGSDVWNFTTDCYAHQYAIVCAEQLHNMGGGDEGPAEAHPWHEHRRAECAERNGIQIL